MVFGIEIVEQPVRVIIESDFWGILLTIGLIVATFIGAGATWYMAYLHKKQQKFENDKEGFLHISKILSNEYNKKVRRKVYEAYCSGKISEEGEILDSDYEPYIEEARTTFGNIGRLVKEGYVPKEILLDTFAGVIIRVWICLAKNIIRERELRQTSRYLDSFEIMYVQAVSHWKLFYPSDPFPNPCGYKTKEALSKSD